MARPASVLASVALALALAGACSSPIDDEPPRARAGQGVSPAAAPVRPPISPSLDLASIAMQTPIYERPDRGARKLGYLRLGAKVHRSERSVPGVGCAGEWYAIAPDGWVCVATGAPARDGRSAGEASLDLGHPLVRALGRAPDLGKPMPYPYAFVRAGTALYLQVPTTDDQRRHEFDLDRWLRSSAKYGRRWNRAPHGGANAVPLDETGVARTPPEAPYPAPPPDSTPEHDLFGGGDSDAMPAWLRLGPTDPARGRRDRELPNVSSFVAPPYAIYGGKIARHAGVALIGTFVAGELAGERRFAITVDGRLLPTDKLKPHYASAFHGVRVDGKDVRFPMGFVLKDGTHAWERDDEHATFRRSGELPRRSVVELTGDERISRGAKWLLATDGRWVRRADLAWIDAPKDMPTEFDWKRTRWIDVSIRNQTLVAWEGERPVYATLVSTGIDGLGDPKTTRSTLRGAFRIDVKHVTATMDADDVESKFELRDVPWVQFFESGYALHATYWHDDFGKPRSHGCVNLAPIDARWLFFWTDPPLPPGWHGVRSGAPLVAGTWVRVRE